MVRMLLDYGANANWRRSCAKPALTIAVGKSNLETVKMILEHGKPDLEARAPAGETALYTAVSKGQILSYSHHRMIHYTVHIMELPTELVLQTFQYLDKADLKHARLVSRLWSCCDSERLFTKLFISPHKLNLRSFVMIARDPVLSRYVKELEYDAVDFSPHLTISEYFDILWHEMSSVISCATRYAYHTPDPQIDHFVSLLRESREPLHRGREIMAQAQVQCRDYAFVQKGYRKWMDQAAFEKKCSEDFTLLNLLTAGLRRLGQLRVVKLRGEWPSRDKLGREGSPLARSWHPFYAHPGRWLLAKQDFGAKSQS